MKSLIGGGLMMVILAILMSDVHSVAYNELCTADSDCTTTNPNTTCHMEATPTCTRGKCLCAPALHWDSGKCKLKKYYLDRCMSSETYCTETTVCTDGQCKCTGAGVTFNTNLRMCTTLKAVGENCNNAADCYTAVANAVECVAPSGSSQTKCACKTGYMLDKGTCRIPTHDEVCTTTTGCYNMLSASDSSLTTETCTGALSTCVCPTTATTEKFLMDGKLYHVCLTTPTAGTTLKNVREVCTQSNECSAKRCLSCPEFPTTGGNQDKKCVAQPTNI